MAPRTQAEAGEVSEAPRDGAGDALSARWGRRLAGVVRGGTRRKVQQDRRSGRVESAVRPPVDNTVGILALQRDAQALEPAVSTPGLSPERAAGKPATGVHSRRARCQEPHNSLQSKDHTMHPIWATHRDVTMSGPLGLEVPLPHRPGTGAKCPMSRAATTAPASQLWVAYRQAYGLWV